MKTKIQKTNLFGNLFRIKYLYPNLLIYKINKRLFKKNLICNFFFYKKFLNFFFLFNKLYFYRIFLQNTKNKFLLNPVYFFKKQFFGDQIFFKNILKNISKNLFLNKKSIKYFMFNKIVLYLNISYLYNNNYCVYNFFEKNELNTRLFLEKYFYISNISDDFFNFYINFHIYLFSILEIYKILILLNNFYK